MDWKTKKVDQFVILNKKLGEGQFGIVYRGHHRDDPTKFVAVKAIPMHKVQQSDLLQQHVMREISILTKIDHPNIVKLIHVTKTQSNLYMILEYCSDGDLGEYLSKKQDKRLSELEAVIFFKHIVNGFKKLFEEKVIHRDIKPQNILLNDGLAKIGDFGFARVVESELQLDLSRVGSPIYMAPQILEGKNFTNKCDVWSLGIMFYELLYGVTPWIGKFQFNNIAVGQIQLLDKITNQPLEFPQFPVRSQKVKTLLTRMLQYKEEDRISWQELFQNEIIAIDEAIIQQNVDQIAKEKDRLMRSVSLNKIYMNDNLILGYMKQNPNQIDDVIENIVSQEEAQIIQQLDSVYKFERNLAFFYNYVIQNLFTLIHKDCLDISQELCFQLMFLISKNQIIKMQDLYKNITKNTDNDYQIYFKSREFKQMLKHLQTDLDQSMKFFVEILRRCLQLQNQARQIVLNEQTKEFYQSYLQILDNNFQYSEEFYNVFMGTLQIVLEKFNHSKDLEKMKMRFYLRIVVDPKMIFDSYTYDFSKFYEEMQYIDAEQLNYFLKQ
ncbi:hypothetical protein pb186bvf_001113 [Paramecium bursaria]